MTNPYAGDCRRATARVVQHEAGADFGDVTLMPSDMAALPPTSVGIDSAERWDDDAMSDLSAPGPVVKWSEEWWASAKPEVQAHRCTAHRKNGDRCKRAAIRGGRVCTHHGGSAPAVKAKARQRIEDAADRMARELLKMAVDENVSDAVKLAAIKDALDRAGLGARTAVSVEVGRPPFEVVFDDITSGSRAESRARRGVPNDQLNEWPAPALVGGNDGDPIVDAELVEPERDSIDVRPTSNTVRSGHGSRKTYSFNDFEG